MEPATRTALAAGCYGIVTHESAPKSEIGWANPTLPLSWAFTPSTGGNFSPFPYQGPPVVPDNPKIEFTEAQAVSMLYRGWIVIWYQTTVPPKETLYAAEQIASLPNNERVLLAQWTNKKKPTWKTGQQWWITGWNKAQPCSKFSLQVVKEFRNANPVTSAPGHQIPLNNPGPKALIVRTQRI